MRSWQFLVDRLGQRYVYAVSSSLVSKVATVLTQLIVMPLAARALGVDAFALYVVLLSAMGWLALANPGIAPTLSIEIARNSVGGSLDAERTLVSSAFFLSSAIALAVAAFFLVIVYIFPVDLWFGKEGYGLRALIRDCLALVALAFVMQSVLVIFEAAHVGRQRQHLVNSVMAVSAIPTLITVTVTSIFSNSLVLFLAATIFPSQVIRLAFLVFTTRFYKSLIPRFRQIKVSVVRGLASVGSVYALAGTFGNFLAHVLPITLVSRTYSAEPTAAFGTVMNLVILISGVTAMIVSPAVPGLAAAWVERRISGVRKAYFGLLAAGMGFSVLVAAVLIFFGPQVMQFWMRGSIDPEPSLMGWAGVYFVFATWEVIHFTVLSALREIKVASLLVFGRALLGALLMVYFLPTETSAAPFVVMVVCIALVNAIPLFLILRTKLALQHDSA